MASQQSIQQTRVPNIIPCLVPSALGSAFLSQAISKNIILNKSQRSQYYFHKNQHHGHNYNGNNHRVSGNNGSHTHNSSGNVYNHNGHSNGNVHNGNVHNGNVYNGNVYNGNGNVYSGTHSCDDGVWNARNGAGKQVEKSGQYSGMRDSKNTKSNWYVGKVKKIQFSNNTTAKKHSKDKHSSPQQSQQQTIHNRKQNQANYDMYRQKSLSIMCQRKLKARILQVLGGTTNTFNPFSTLQRQPKSKSITNKNSRSYVYYRVINQNKANKVHPLQIQKVSLEKIRSICQAKLLNLPHSRKMKNKQSEVEENIEYEGRNSVVKVTQVVNVGGKGRKIKTEGNDQFGKRGLMECCPWEREVEEDDGMWAMSRQMAVRQ